LIARVRGFPNSKRAADCKSAPIDAVKCAVVGGKSFLQAM
jgi:hypothetical protein